MNARELLLQAADLIEKQGWGQRVYFGSPLLCPVTALGGFIGPGAEELIAAADLLRSQLPEEFERSIVMWNDAPGRTAAEVLATMRTAAGQPETVSGKP